MLDRLAVDVGHAECESDDFSLSTLRKDEKDKLGNTVKEILWIEKDYAIYCSDKGIYVQFSDCPQQRKVQRSQFTKIVPELCELRYLTAQMRRRSPLRRSSEPRHTLYDHNMAQALMLAMEGEAPRAKQLAESTLKMAVQRVTSDNTARYVRACFGWGLALIAIGAIASWLLPHVGDPQARWSPYVVAGMFGVLGAVFSVATRTEALKLRPCDESSMNVWMAAVRVAIGVMSAIALLLFADTLLTDMFGKIAGLNGGKFSTHPTGRDDLIFWPTVALLGFVGGFAERLIPNILRQTTDQIQSSAGTPVQLARTLPRKSVQNGSSGTTSP